MSVRVVLEILATLGSLLTVLELLGFTELGGQVSLGSEAGQPRYAVFAIFLFVFFAFSVLYETSRSLLSMAMPVAVLSTVTAFFISEALVASAEAASPDLVARVSRLLAVFSGFVALLFVFVGIRRWIEINNPDDATAALFGGLIWGVVLSGLTYGLNVALIGFFAPELGL